MKTSVQKNLFSFFVLFVFVLFSSYGYSQDKGFVGNQIIKNGNMTAIKTIPKKAAPGTQNFNNKIPHTKITSPQYVLGGNVIWHFQDAAAIANTVRLNGNGSIPFTAWGLNNMRASLYSDVNNIPVWEYSTVPNDPNIGMSDDGSVLAVTRGTEFDLLNQATGTVTYQQIMPDSLYATYATVTRDGSHVVFLAQAQGNGNTSVAYCLDLTGGTPSIAWTLAVPAGEISNWTGANFSASGNRVIINGRMHMYVLNSADGTLIWDRFIDNTESPAVISGDGNIIATADLSGFVQARMFDSSTNQYNLLWQYHVPVGIYTNWASAVAISADGSTILAGSLIFNSSDYDGSIMCFDTYGDGTPRWVYSGTGDEVQSVALSDDGKVAAAATWGDLNNTKPDLYVFDVATGQVTFSVTTPGSFFTVSMSHDGQKVFAGGKAVHARAFGNGGLIYYASIDLGGGSISGNVNLSGTTDNSGVLVKAVGTPRSAVTNSNGDYTIQNVTAGTYTISAEKPGYNYGSVTGVVVTNGNTTPNINFALDQFTTIPPTLSATTNLNGEVLLNWTSFFTSPQKKMEIAKIVGDNYPGENNGGSNTMSVLNNRKMPRLNIPVDHEILSDSVAIFRSIVSGGPYTKIAAVDIANTSYADSLVLPLKNYYYVVNIFNTTGQSVYSNEVLGKVNDSLFTFNFNTPQGTVPTIDGVLSPGEWDDAIKVDVSDVLGYSGGTPKPAGSVYMYFKYDPTTQMLYVAGEDFLNTTLDDNEGFGLYFDDNDNKMFEPSNAFPIFEEGNFWAYWHPSGSDLRFRPIYTGGAVGTVINVPNAQVAFSDASGHLTGEVAIPMGFINGYQLQVYGPNNQVGLGAFAIERDAGVPVFNGWWPQTMNSVFNPQYFGDVKINIILPAPPQVPGNISVTKQGSSLLLGWADPTLGLNNYPLPSSPTMDIYKNSIYLTNIGSGVQSYLDDAVGCSYWYEYKMDAYIVDNGDTLKSPISNPVGNFACFDPTLTQISYDDGTWEVFSVVSFSYDDNKFALRVTPPYYPARVERVTTTVNSNAPFNFTIQQDSSGFPGKLIAGPYLVNATGSGTVNTVTLTLPGSDPPIISSGDFWVLINYLPSSPGAPGIGVDNDPPISNRGFYYTSSTGWQSIGSANLMITSYVSDTTTTVTPVELVGFSGAVKGNNVLLTWKTATETNNHGFEVQRSMDRKTFSDVGFVQGSGTTTEEHSYSYSDNPQGEKIYYRLKQIDLNGGYTYSNIIEVDNLIPTEYSLSQNYPNPFNPSTVIKYQLPKSSNVTLEIYDLLGQRVCTLVNENQEAGKYNITWNGKNNFGNQVSSGIYIYRIKAGNFIAVKKMMLLK